MCVCMCAHMCASGRICVCVKETFFFVKVVHFSCIQNILSIFAALTNLSPVQATPREIIK